MSTSTQSYEFLARWNTETGALGMHYKTADIYRDGAGKFLFDKIGGPLPVLAGSDVLGQVFADLNLSTLKQVDDLTAQLATAKSNADQAAKDAQAVATQAAQDLAAAKAATADVQAKLDAANQAAQTAAASAADQIKQLQTQLAAATAPQTGSTDGYLVPDVTPPLVLDDSEAAQTRFTSLVTLALLAEKAGAITDDTEQTITDQHGSPRTVTTGQLFALILGYGQHCQSLFAAKFSALAA